MSNYVTLHGFVSSEVELNTKESGLVVGKFRMGSTHRVQDPVTKEWVDGATNWFRVSIFRTLAHNVVASVRKGDRIIVTGKMKINNWLKLDGTQGTAVDIEAETVGIDLKFGTCTYHRNAAQRGYVPGQYNKNPLDQNAETYSNSPAGQPGSYETGDDAPPLAEPRSQDYDASMDQRDDPYGGGAMPDGPDGTNDPDDGNDDDEEDAEGQVAAEGEILFKADTGELVETVGSAY